MGKNVAIHEEGECSRLVEYSEVWKNLWSLHVSGVVKIFLWNACNNFLLTKENLFKKKVMSDPLCPMCGVEVENTCHILWHYPSLCDVWENP